MAPDVIELHPEVEEILREVAAQPGSVLLRVPRGRELRTLREDASLASPTDSALSRAERHLVAVYREEVAFALRQAAWYRMVTDGPRAQLVYTRVTPTRQLAVPSRKGVASSATLALAFHGETRDHSDVTKVLEHLAHPSADSPDAAIFMLASAHRLVPSVRGRILAGSAYALDQQTYAASSCIVDSIKCIGLADLRAICLNNLAHVLDEAGRCDTALSMARAAARLLPGFIPAEATRLGISIRLGIASEAQDAIVALEEAAHIEPECLEEVARRFESVPEPKSLARTADASTLAKRLAERSGSATRRLLDALS